MNNLESERIPVITLWQQARYGLMRQAERAIAAIEATRTQTDQQLREDVERLREAFTALDRIVSENIVETGEPDRVRWKGVWYDGPLATAYLTTLRVIQKLARSSLSSSSLTNG